MRKSPLPVKQFHLLGLRALQLLRHSPYTYLELMDKLCIGRRYTEQLMQYLRESGFIIHSRVENRKKYFWTNTEINFLSSVLTEAEKAAVETVLTDRNLHLQTAFYKLTQLLRF